ncbi:MAG: hypothetical protein EOP48_15820 [Sphingobacteriales bacterium]|nr:MAG: hypothetical protein EOP48_15820 [Sphingobacteriales bacterium]
MNITKKGVIEGTARYFLVFWFSLCVADGWAFLLFDMHIFGEAGPPDKFLPFLMATTWFWVFLKIIQTIAVLSLLANYKPALGLALLTPISSVLALFYLFDLVEFWPIAPLIFISTAILIRAYWSSYEPLLKS